MGQFNQTYMSTIKDGEEIISVNVLMDLSAKMTF